MLILLKVLLVIAVLALAVVGNVFFYSFKVVLRREGYPTSLFFGFLGDIPEFLELIRKQSDPERKRNYQTLFVGLVLTTVLYLSLGAVLIFLL